MNMICDLYLLPTCVIAKLCNKQVRRHFMTLIIENNSGHMSMRNSFSQSQPHSKVFHVAAPIFGGGTVLQDHKAI